MLIDLVYHYFPSLFRYWIYNVFRDWNSIIITISFFYGCLVIFHLYNFAKFVNWKRLVIWKLSILCNMFGESCNWQDTFDLGFLINFSAGVSKTVNLLLSNVNWKEVYGLYGIQSSSLNSRSVSFEDNTF